MIQYGFRSDCARYHWYSAAVIPLCSRYWYIVAVTSWPKSRSSERNRRSFMKAARFTICGLPGCTYSVDSLNTNVASDRTSRMARIIRIDALTECFKLVMKAWSLTRRSFHQPNAAENWAVMQISLTGVY